MRIINSIIIIVVTSMVYLGWRICGHGEVDLSKNFSTWKETAIFLAITGFTLFIMEYLKFRTIKEGEQSIGYRFYKKMAYDAALLHKKLLKFPSYWWFLLRLARFSVTYDSWRVSPKRRERLYWIIVTSAIVMPLAITALVAFYEVYIIHKVNLTFTCLLLNALYTLGLQFVRGCLGFMIAIQSAVNYPEKRKETEDLFISILRFKYGGLYFRIEISVTKKDPMVMYIDSLD